MKAATLYQPWATLVAIKAKRIETRSWATKYRGELGIHASTQRRFINNRSKDYICDEEPFYSVLTGYYRSKSIVPWYILPKGMIVAVCELKNCILIEPPYSDHIILGLSDQEKVFGDYTPGRFMWFLENVRELKKPIPAKGALGLWEWTPPEDLAFK